MNIFTQVKSVAIVSALVFSISANAQTGKNVTTTAGGQLSTLISSSEKYTTTSLTVSGPINGADIAFIREMAGKGTTARATTNGILANIDLANANIVASSDVYYSTSRVNYTTEDNVIGTASFSNLPNLTSLILPKTATSLAASSLINNTGITSLTLPEALTTIGNSALQGLTALTSISFPASLTSIGNYGLMNCNSLTSITFATGSQLTTLGQSAFSGCTGITSISLPNSTREIGASSFYGCTGLTTFNTPTNLQSIGNLAFSGCTSLSTVSELPASLTTIGTGVFTDAPITSYSVNSGNTNFIAIDGVVYSADKATLYLYPIGSGLTSYEVNSDTRVIYGAAFTGSKLTSVTLPEGLTTLGSNSFTRSSLTSITLPSTVTTIGGSSFNNCPNLTVAYIKGTLNALTTQIFASSSRLSNIYWYSTTPPSTVARNCLNNMASTATMYVPTGTVTNWTDALTVSNTAATTTTLVFEEYDYTNDPSTGIASTPTDNDSLVEIARYNATGQQLSSPTKGINIIKYNDGSIKKVIE